MLCPWCSQGFTTGRYWLRHCERAHVVHPNASHSHRDKACQTSKKSSSAGASCQEADTDTWCLENQDDSTSETKETSREKIGKFLLRLQSEYGVSKAATSFVASEVQEIIDAALKEQNDDKTSDGTSVQQACREFASEYKLSKFCHEEL